MKKLILLMLLLGTFFTNLSAQTTPTTPTVNNMPVLRTAPKGTVIKNGKLYAASGYKFVIAADKKSAVLHKISNGGNGAVEGTYKCLCWEGTGTCSVFSDGTQLMCYEGSCKTCKLSITTNSITSRLVLQ